MDTRGTITQLLSRVRTGDRQASDQLFDHVYSDLKRMAGALLAERNFRLGQLGSTALVNAACERLLRTDKLQAHDRRHFFFILSRAMRDVLVEEARADLAAKRGGRLRRVPLGDFAADGDPRFVGVLDVHQALDELTAHDPEAAETVMLRFFGGCSLNEIAELTGCSFATVRRNWEYSRAWLHERLSDRRSNSGDL